MSRLGPFQEALENIAVQQVRWRSVIIRNVEVFGAHNCN